ncbi:hypothetical protein Lal_00008556 [Lupinus albus]|nr:hypothetical protein Lal_00008556 [Lupinus albus]
MVRDAIQKEEEKTITRIKGSSIADKFLTRKHLSWRLRNPNKQWHMYEIQVKFQRRIINKKIESGDLTYLISKVLIFYSAQSLSLLMNMFLYQKPFVLSFLALFITCLCHCYATPFIVGDSSGWVIPPYPSYYSNWAHSHLMRVGDSLEFHFYHKLYNLVQVRQNNYDHCTTLEPVEIFNSSPAIIPLKEKGKLYLSDTINPTNKKQHQVHYSSNNKNPYTENTQQSRERTKGYNQEAVCQTIRKHTEDS